MFGECHAHIIMDGKNYKAAVSLHRNGPAEGPIRQHLEAWQQAGVTFVRDGGDALGVSARARELAPEYGIDYRTPVFAIHKKGHYGGIVGHAFEDRKEYRELVERAKREGADFIKIMISGIMEFDQFGVLNEEGLSGEEIREMIGADSLGYMEVSKLKDMAGGLGYCDACFTGHYPMEVPGRDQPRIRIEDFSTTKCCRIEIRMLL